MNESEAIRGLEETGRYRIIRQLEPPGRYCRGEPATARTGIVIDTETTGLDTATNRIIELGLIAFEYDAASGLIYRILHTCNGLEDPGEPLTDIVKRITGISDEMLAGQQLDQDEISSWIHRADLVIAHNAGFDRRVLERRLPEAVGANWGCTMHDINWQDEDISSLKLDYIAYRLGYFFEGHRAVNDAQATLHLLSKPLPVSGRPAMAALLSAARESNWRLFAVGAPFDKKDELKARGYRWLGDCTYTDSRGRPKKGVWSTTAAAADIEAEKQWLNDTVYPGMTATFIAREITAKDRYSLREFRIGE